MIKVAIIDYGMGNLFSVTHACKFYGIDPVITTNRSEIENADGVILPGVGAFSDGMDNLKSSNTVDALYTLVERNRPILAICLGFQMLFDESHEFGKTNGLGLIKGTVKKFPEVHNGVKLKIPQIGWNNIYKKMNHSIFNGIEDEEFMYFVHSYYVQTYDDSVVLSTTKYEGFEYCSSVQKNNLFGFQFHPEKSGKKGLLIYRNFLQSIKVR